METIQDYYKVLALSNTALGYLKKSAFHCWEFMNGRIKFDSKPMKIGRHLHAAVLEPETITIAVIEDLRTKDGKALAEKYKKENITVLGKGEFETYQGCLASLKNNVTIQKWLQNAECEKEFYFEYRGVFCKIKPDVISKVDGKTILIDFKFMQDSNPQEFMRKAAKVYDYDRQAAWYINGYEIATKEKVDEFYFICVEKSAPFCVSIIRVKPQQLEIGKAKYDYLVDRYLETIAVGKYPAYDQEIYEWGEEIEELDLSLAGGEPMNLLNAGGLADFSKIIQTLKQQN